MCTVGCTRDRDCDSPLVCRVGRCEPECDAQHLCEPPLICQDAQCVPECVDDRDCEMGEYCIKGECGVECLTDDECEGGLTCREGACVPACLTDEECAEGEVCEMSQDGEPRCMPSDDPPVDPPADPVEPYTGLFLISSSTPIKRCNDLVSINFDPRLAETTQEDQRFTLTLVNPPTVYVGNINNGSFTVSWSGLNGQTEHCGSLNTSNTYRANFTGEDIFMGVLTVDFFFQVGSCDCQIQWPILGVRQ